MAAEKSSETSSSRSRKTAAPKAPPIDAAITVDAGDWTQDTAPMGAHVSIAGGTWEAASRAREISATGAQLFTKQANRWAERDITDEEAARFRTAMQATQVRWLCAHDSYLINLASPDAELRARSLESFRTELRRCHALGLDALVSHPGNFMDVRTEGLARNADAIAEALDREPGPTRLLMELTAGQGTVLGSTFEEMAELLGRIPAALRSRVGVCLDTAHIWAAGYDLTTDYDSIWRAFDAALGLEALGCLHLNDSKAKLGSHLDRHDLIGEGTIGSAAFERIMTDPRLAAVPKILETPKGDNPAQSDGRMLKLLRSFAASARAVAAVVALPFAAQLAPTRTATAQPAATDAEGRWHVAQEVVLLGGGTWLDGSRIPRVASRAGGAIAIGVSRAVRPELSAGLLLRGALTPLSMQEVGDRWSGGTLREASVLGSWSADALARGRWHLDVDAMGGITVFGGAGDLPPFRDAGLLSPTAELGLRLLRPRDETSTVTPTGIVARVSVTRIGASAVNAIATSGWVTRLVFGVRRSR